MKKIADLSKQELLGLIYHTVPTTLYEDHPCECAVCGSEAGPEVDINLHGGLLDGNKFKVKLYFYECDKCRLEDK